MKGEKNFYFSSAISTFVELHSKIEVTAEEVRENVGRNEMKWKTIGRAFWLKQIKSEFQFAWKKKIQHTNLSRIACGSHQFVECIRMQSEISVHVCSCFRFFLLFASFW